MTGSLQVMGPSPKSFAGTLIFAGLPDSDPQGSREKLNSPEAVSGHRVHRIHRILIIEDNVDAATSLGDYLELMGHEVRLAFSGPEGVDAAAQFGPEVVICDVGLPGMDGWAVARALRQATAGPAVHLVAVTGYGTDDDRRRSMEAGFEAHLTKPLDLNALDGLLARFV